MLSPTLRGDQVIEVRQPCKKRLLAPFGMMESLHGEPFPLNGVMGLIQKRAGRWHLRVFEDRIPPRFLGLKPLSHPRTIDLPGGVGDVIGKAA